MGLRNFIGREIELQGPASQLELVLATAQGLAGYLIQSGSALRDGDTIGDSETEHIQVRFEESRRFGGLPVISAMLPAAS
jgi:hypothetical protein